ncbi:MAG: glycosyltransferase family 2 protein [Candidatus Dojkabacteria bacterium]|nr:glycosyltransferase family 2 protein [Candidatus Dojkabacteria bacterium]
MKKSLSGKSTQLGVSRPSVAVVIVNFNGINLLRKHLPTVLATRYEHFSVVVVDNASTDGSVEWLQAHYPQVSIIQNEKNLGFGRANNRAFHEISNVSYFALLNSDMSVGPDWLVKLVESAESDERIAAVGPKILYARKDARTGKPLINSAGGVIDRFDRGFDRGEGEIDRGQYDRREQVRFVSGGAMLLRAEAVREVEGFDDRMFFYYEDVDVCLRLAEKGWKIWYDGSVAVFHDHMGTISRVKHTNVTLMSNMNRIKSIASRRGIVPAIVEFFRSPLEWLVHTLYGKITGKTYREYLVKQSGATNVTIDGTQG